jgi:hypothetical protein
MTLVSILSVSGAPGVSTLACLLASTWAVPGPVTVVECDASGGDLAARFGLSSSVGWPSLIAAVRRTGSSTPLDPHLQYLPGGLPVLVGAHQGPPAAADGPEAEVVRSWSVADGRGGIAGHAGDSGDGDDAGAGDGGRGPGLVVIDLGRLPHAMEATDGWLEAADWTVVVVRDDPAGAVRVRNRAAELLARTEGRLGLVVVGANGFRCRELTELAGLVPLGDVPFDPESAAVASGASGAVRRLDRSQLLATVRRVALVVAARTVGSDLVPAEADRQVMSDGDSVGDRSTTVARLSSIWPRSRRPPVEGRV